MENTIIDSNTSFVPADSPLRIGIDVGSTTVKIVVLDIQDTVLYSDYERHRADIRSTIISVVTKALDEVEQKVPLGKSQPLSVRVTGSGGLAVSHWLDIPFIQEVVASTTAVRRLIPKTDVVIELGRLFVQAPQLAPLAGRIRRCGRRVLAG